MQSGDSLSSESAGNATTFSSRLAKFVHRPRKEKYLALALRARGWFPRMPIPLRLDFGAWWLAQESALDEKLIYEGFETAELKFVERLLRPGMTVVDAGAHHGLYTLLASKRVGRPGKVIAFEPSPRERLRLLQHIRLNRCGNVVVQSCALGEQKGEADLFVVDGRDDWFNSLRPPAVTAQTKACKVDVRRLDEALAALGVRQVDFIKLDVEGAELSFLRGAVGILHGPSRPAILTEIQDCRTQPWGYAAREILEFLEGRRYRWFEIKASGKLAPASTNLALYDANLVALPEERIDEFLNLLAR